MNLLLAVFVVLLVLLLGIAALALFISVFVGVPFVPTHQKQARHMVELAGITPGMNVIDLGSGAGRLLFLAARAGARTTGYELNPFLYWWTKIEARLKGMSNVVDMKCQSLYDADVSKADVVLAFLFPEPMKRLGPKLFSEMKPGSKIVSYAFAIPNREPRIKEDGIYVYEVA